MRLFTIHGALSGTSTEMVTYYYVCRSKVSLHLFQIWSHYTPQVIHVRSASVPTDRVVLGVGGPLRWPTESATDRLGVGGLDDPKSRGRGRPTDRAGALTLASRAIVEMSLSMFCFNIRATACSKDFDAELEMILPLLVVRESAIEPVRVESDSEESDREADGPERDGDGEEDSITRRVSSRVQHRRCPGRGHVAACRVCSLAYV